MEKYHRYISAFIGLGFLLMLLQFPVQKPLFRFLAAATAVFLILLSWYNRWYLKKIGKYNFWTWLRPALYYASAVAVFAVLPTSGLRIFFLGLAAALGFAFQIFLGNYSENVVLNESLIVAFGLFTAAAAANFYFPSFHNLYLISVFAGSLVITRCYFEFTPQPQNLKLATSVTLALLCLELFWVLSFLPFHYSAQAILLFNFYYCGVILAFYSAFNTLNSKKIKFHVALMAVCAALVLIATPWSSIA